MEYNGIQNKGATCYLNSYLQALYHIPAFRRAVYSIDTSKDSLDSPTIAIALQYLFYLLQTSDEAVTVSVLTRSFEKTPGFDWEENEEHKQHDIQEFSKKLIDVLERDMKEFLKNMLCGQIVTNLTWGVEGKERNVPEEFYDISLNVKDCYTLETALEQFCAEEDLKGENQYVVEHEKVDAKRRILLDRLPPILSLHLKRWDSKFGKQKKLNDYQEFSETLEIPKSIRKSQSPDEFKLYAVFTHRGTTLAGHYTAHIRPDLQNWWKFNDSKVSKSTEDEAINSNYGGDGDQSAYMLIYVNTAYESEYFNGPVEIPKVLADKFSTWVPETSISFLFKVKVTTDSMLHGDIPSFTLECGSVDDLMNQVATKYHIPIHKQRYWNFRHNKGETESKPISYEYMLAVGVALDGQWFFVEEIPEVDVDLDTHTLLLVKNIDMAESQFDYLGMIYASNDTPISKIQIDHDKSEDCPAYKQVGRAKMMMIDTNKTVQEAGFLSCDTLILQSPSDGARTNIKGPCPCGYGHWCGGKKYDFVADCGVGTVGFNLYDNAKTVVMDFFKAKAKKAASRLPEHLIIDMASTIRSKQIENMPRKSSWDVVANFEGLIIAFNVDEDPAVVAESLVDSGLKGKKTELLNFIKRHQKRAAEEEGFTPKSKIYVKREVAMRRIIERSSHAIPFPGPPSNYPQPIDGQLVSNLVDVYNPSLEGNSELYLTPDECASLRKIGDILVAKVQNETVFNSTIFEANDLVVFRKLIKWPLDYIRFVLNALRLLILYKSAATFFIEHRDGTFFNDIIGLAEKKIDEKATIFILRLIANCFYQRQLRQELYANQEKLLSAIKELVQGAQSLKKEIATEIGRGGSYCLLNLSHLIYEKFDDSPKESLRYSSIIGQFCAMFFASYPKDEVIARNALIAFGTTLVTNGGIHMPPEDFKRRLSAFTESVSEIAEYVAYILSCTIVKTLV